MFAQHDAVLLQKLVSPEASHGPVRASREHHGWTLSVNFHFMLMIMMMTPTSEQLNAGSQRR